MIAGREFTDDDLGRSEPIAVVSEELARQFGDPASAVGRYLTAERWPSIRIVGVTKGLRPYGPAYSPQPTAYLLSRTPDELTIVAAVAGSARDRLGVIREAVQAVDPKVPVFNIRTMDERLDAVLARPRFYTTTLIFFGGLALLLAVIGLYGIVSYGVQQRTREMGIRLALGTTPGRLRGAVLRQTFTIIAAGAVAGTLLTSLFGRYLQSLVHGALSSATRSRSASLCSPSPRRARSGQRRAISPGSTLPMCSASTARNDLCRELQICHFFSHV